MKRARRKSKPDYEKMRSCDHAGLDPHRDTECKKCGRIQWYTARTASEALKQHFMFSPAVIEAFAKRRG